MNDVEQALKIEPRNAEIAALAKEIVAKKKSYKQNSWNTLGLEYNATLEQVRTAYKKLALKWHPDKNGQSEEHRWYAEHQFKKIAEAYTELKQPNAKPKPDTRKYDDDDDGDDDEEEVARNSGFNGYRAHSSYYEHSHNPGGGYGSAYASGYGYGGAYANSYGNKYGSGGYGGHGGYGNKRSGNKSRKNKKK
jgi:DnaJ family protein B protein 4